MQPIPLPGTTELINLWYFLLIAHTQFLRTQAPAIRLSRMHYLKPYIAHQLVMFNSPQTYLTKKKKKSHERKMTKPLTRDRPQHQHWLLVLLSPIRKKTKINDKKQNTGKAKRSHTVMSREQIVTSSVFVPARKTHKPLSPVLLH